MAEIEASITYLGSLARKILSEPESASILGISSRGIFLLIGRRWVIFLSYESYRGSLTLNLDHAIPTPIDIDRTQSVAIRDGRIYFTGTGSNIAMRFANAKDWLISPHPLPILVPFERDQSIRAIGQEVIIQRGEFGLAPVFANLLQMSLPKQFNQPAYIDRVDIHQLVHILRSPDEGQIIMHLQKFLGLGSGLTPSGDDLINGLLLTYNRYSDVLNPPFDLPSINEAIVDLAYQKTSLLSANLIEAASVGQSDERLILALDGMLAGTIDPASCANHLLSWGNSSGCDALLGMALAVYSSQEHLQL